MQANRVKKILKEGGLALATYVGGIADPQIVEIIGHAEFDAAFIDMEHTRLPTSRSWSWPPSGSASRRSCARRGSIPRSSCACSTWAAGHPGAAHRRRAGGPRGGQGRAPRAGRDRGMAGASRASGYGTIAMKDHMGQSNREIMLAVMVEDLPALAEIDAIASTEGVDLVAVGSSDMSRALGVGGMSDHPKLIETIHRMADAVRKGGVARQGLPMNDPTFPRNAGQLSSAWGTATARRRPRCGC